MKAAVAVMSPMKTVMSTMIMDMLTEPPAIDVFPRCPMKYMSTISRTL